VLPQNTSRIDSDGGSDHCRASTAADKCKQSCLPPDPKDASPTYLGLAVLSLVLFVHRDFTSFGLVGPRLQALFSSIFIFGSS
jgi:hypothetical protein